MLRKFWASIRRLRSRPTDKELYVHLRQMVSLIQSSSGLLENLIINAPNPDERGRIKQEIKRNESFGDGVQDAISQFTARSLVPPFPSQDINTLTDALDDILDSINDAANQFFHHEISTPPAELVKIAGIIGEMGKTFTDEVITSLEKFQHPNHIYNLVMSLERQADDVKNIGIPAITKRTESFNQFKTTYAVGQIIRELERATNKFEKAIIIIKGVISKHV